MKIKKVDIFGIKYSVTDYDEASSLIIRHAQKHTGFAVFALPVQGLVLSRSDIELKEATNIAEMIVPDGQPIKWVMNYFYKADLKDRVYGPELTSHVLRKANKYGLRVCLYGGRTQGVLDKFIDYISGHYPDIFICGAFREECFAQERISINDVKSVRPDSVLVGLGCPTQEKWIARNKASINATLIGVGAAFSFFSGDLKMAPKWMQDNGLEWLYRLMKEPKRLWKRYLFTNAYFIWLVIVKLFKPN